MQEAQWAREAEIAKIEAEQQRLKMIALIEQKTAQVLPLLEEIRDFANTTKTFPLGTTSGSSVTVTDSSRVVVIPEIVGNGLGEIQLQYGFKGLEYYYTEGDDLNSGGHGKSETYVLFGIRLKVNPDEVLLFRRREEKIFVPSCEDHTILAGKGGSIGIKGHGSYTKAVYKEEWQRLSDDKAKLKVELADAFYDPSYLIDRDFPSFPRKVIFQPEPQTSTGIAGLVKGFLGLK